MLRAHRHVTGSKASATVLKLGLIALARNVHEGTQLAGQRAPQWFNTEISAPCPSLLGAYLLLCWYPFWGPPIRRMYRKPI